MTTSYRLSDDPADLDLDTIHRWLSEQAYWALGRSRDVVVTTFARSSAAGLYDDTGAQVGVARIVSDSATFAYLCDVFVDPGHRGRGLGRRLARWSVDWAEDRGVPLILLATRSAHRLYAAEGYGPLADAWVWMQIDRRPPMPAPSDIPG